MYALADYRYELPEELIAQKPSAQRERSRLMHLQRSGGRLTHHDFTSLGEFLSPADVLVINDTAVIPGRLVGRKDTGGRAEVLLLDYGQGKGRKGGDGDLTFTCLLKAAKRTHPGSRIHFAPGLEAEVLAVDSGVYTLQFYCNGDFEDFLERIGHVPLPPYIKRNFEAPAATDRAAYQTVYARHKGAIAAPTAGLHFTRVLLDDLANRGVRIAPITLHIGYGTFAPVRVTDIRAHAIHSEWYEVGASTAEAVNRARAEGGRVVAVGTTCVRTLEYAVDARGRLTPGGGRCDLFIYPGYRFKVIDAMLTNFHLPESTLLMLVAAFAGRTRVLEAYREAVRHGYRFYSYGDAMFID